MNTYIITKKDGNEVKVKAESMHTNKDDSTVSFNVYGERNSTDMERGFGYEEYTSTSELLVGVLSLNNHDIICVRLADEKVVESTKETAS